MRRSGGAGNRGVVARSRSSVARRCRRFTLLRARRAVPLRCSSTGAIPAICTISSIVVLRFLFLWPRRRAQRLGIHAGFSALLQSFGMGGKVRPTIERSRDMAKGMKMRSVRTLLLGAVGALMLGAGLPTTAAAAPAALPVPALQGAPSGVQDIGWDRGRHRHNGWNRGHRHDHGWGRGDQRWRSGWHGRDHRDRHGHHWRRDDRGGHWGHHRGYSWDRHDRRHDDRRRHR